MTTIPLLPGARRWTWRAGQLLAWLGGVGILTVLFLRPTLGINLMWNGLIPLAPALFAIAPGLWRNLCPLGSTALVSRHMGWSLKRPVTPEWRGRLLLGSVALLLLILPLRHVIFDLNGPATAIIILALGMLAIGCGLMWQWKSAWCSGLCPVHVVERLYGSEPAFTLNNAHCHRCETCTIPCPDSVPGISLLHPDLTRTARVAGIIMLGGFCGFIWGWFQVPDYAGSNGWSHLPQAYGWSFGAGAATLISFLILRRIVPSPYETRLNRIFAASAISCYYWYRLPALFGFSAIADDGMLVDLTGTLPGWFPLVSRAVTTTFFFYWLAWRVRGTRPWLIRPPYAEDRTTPKPSTTGGVSISLMG